MKRHQHRVLAVVSLAAGLWVAAPARAASLTQVSRATWGATGVPSYVNMYIYVPDKLATKPPIVVAHHSCGTAVSGYISSISGIQAAADRNGFILILPEATNRNCWDVGSTASLTHDGGGDTQAVAQMVKYALTKYSGDASRVYAMGGSSGAMMTQALMAVYPDIFKAGSARAGVPAACWADGYDATQQWSDNCAGGRTSKTAQQWGDLVRGMYRTYTGPRRRIQLFHGTADTTINYNNMGEAIKEWTNVLALSMTPTSTDMLRTTSSNYTRQFWKNACGFTVFETWAGMNGTHSMPYEQDAILSFFGLDQVRAVDPEETACSGDGGVGGASGSGGSGGTTGAGGAGGGGARDGGVDGGNDAGAGTAGRGGAQGGGGISGSSGAAGTGGGAGTGGAGGTATGGRGVAGRGGGAGSTGVAGTGGSVAIGGRGGASTGGVSGGAGAAAPGGSSGGGAAGSGGGDPPDAGCGGCVIASDAGHPTPTLAALLVTALGLVLRRRRRQRP